MQAARRAAAQLLRGARQYGAEPGALAHPDKAHPQNKWWYIKATQAQAKANKNAADPEFIKKGMRGDMLGFIILGVPAILGMTYDFIWGLENEEFHVIPPYPHMRLRTRNAFPWGEDGLFEMQRHVPKPDDWDPAAYAEAHHGHGEAH